MQDNAEVELFGFKRFAEPELQNATWQEVTQRPIYIAFNQMRLSNGNPIFGAIAFIFKPKVVRPMTFVAPVDTGIWEMSCNQSGARHHDWPTDCSGYSGVWNSTNQQQFKAWPLGTMEHHLHLYLQNTRFWNLTDAEGLSLLFGRLFKPASTNMTTTAQNFYMEANLAGAPPLPAGVHAVVGNFDQLVGTAAGAELRKWCANSSWALLWARTPPGAPVGHHGPPSSFRDDGTRLIDPTVVRVLAAAGW